MSKQAIKRIEIANVQTQVKRQQLAGTKDKLLPKKMQQKK